MVHIYNRCFPGAKKRHFPSPTMCLLPNFRPTTNNTLKKKAVKFLTLSAYLTTGTINVCSYSSAGMISVTAQIQVFL